MIVDAGYAALPIALVVSGYAVLASFLGGLQRVPALVLSGRYGFYTIPVLLAVSTAALVYAFVNHDLLGQVRCREQQPGDARRLHMGRLLRRQRRLSAVHSRRILAAGGRRRGEHDEASSLHISLRHRSDGRVFDIPSRRHRLSRQSAGAPRLRAHGRTRHQPAARPLRHVHTPASPDDRARVGGRAVQHRHGRDAGAAGRARRVGGPGQGVGHGVVATADHWAAAGAPGGPTPSWDGAATGHGTRWRTPR